MSAADVQPFTPLQPVPRRDLMLRALVAPLLWLMGLVGVAVVVHRTDAIMAGLLIALAAFTVSIIGLALLRSRRERERRRYEQRG